MKLVIEVYVKSLRLERVSPFTKLRFRSCGKKASKSFDCQVRQVKHESARLYVSLSALFTATNNKLSTELLRSFPQEA